jgi:hypothetical protein
LIVLRFLAFLGQKKKPKKRNAKHVVLNRVHRWVVVSPIFLAKPILVFQGAEDGVEWEMPYV